MNNKLKITLLAVLMSLAWCASYAQTKAKEPVKTLEIGQEAPDFTLADNKGDSLCLSSLRGQYVVLDFWGTWCKWCISGMPKMKEYYEKYAGKFEIVSVDVMDKKQKWLDYLANADMPWKQVRQTPFNMVSKLYYVRAYPSKFVIDPEGKIIKISAGEDKRFYSFLDDLFKE